MSSVSCHHRLSVRFGPQFPYLSKYCLGVTNSPSPIHTYFAPWECVFNLFSDIGQPSARLMELRGWETKQISSQASLPRTPLQVVPYLSHLNSHLLKCGSLFFLFLRSNTFLPPCGLRRLWPPALAPSFVYGLRNSSFLHNTPGFPSCWGRNQDWKLGVGGEGLRLLAFAGGRDGPAHTWGPVLDP